MCRYDGIGRRAGLKIQWWRHRTGSTPVTGTIIGQQKDVVPENPDEIGVFMFQRTIFENQNHRCNMDVFSLRNVLNSHDRQISEKQADRSKKSICLFSLGHLSVEINHRLNKLPHIEQTVQKHSLS